MKKTLTLPDTIEACHDMVISQARLIEQYGVVLSAVR